MNENAAQYLHRWKKKQELRKQQNSNGIFYKIQHDLNGSIKIEATIKPEAMATALIVAESFHLAVIDASTTLRSQHAQIEKERLENEAGKLEFRKSERIALSIFRRTGSRRLAAHFMGGSRNAVRMTVARAAKRQKEAHRAARNTKIYQLNQQGLSIRTVASHYDLHPSTVHTIIKREAQAMQPALF
ncbi:MAG: hypothetical protein R8K20_11695 [Gallionellaceae bacterium]